MRRFFLAMSCVVLVTASGCSGAGDSTAADSQVAEVEQAPEYLVSAATFVAALETRDHEALARLIPSDELSPHADELATMQGEAPVGDGEFTWDGRLLEADFDGLTVRVSGEPDDVLAGVPGDVALDLGLAEASSGWVVETVDGQSSVYAALWRTPTGEACYANLNMLRGLALMVSVAGEPVATMDELLELADSEPVCPTGGEYSLDSERAAMADWVTVCSIHGTCEVP